jgi:hypothetical protein
MSLLDGLLKWVEGHEFSRLITKKIDLKNIIEEGFQELLENEAEHIKVIIGISVEKGK